MKTKKLRNQDIKTNIKSCREFQAVLHTHITQTQKFYQNDLDNISLNSTMGNKQHQNKQYKLSNFESINLNQQYEKKLNSNKQLETLQSKVEKQIKQKKYKQIKFNSVAELQLQSEIHISCRDLQFENISEIKNNDKDIHQVNQEQKFFELQDKIAKKQQPESSKYISLKMDLQKFQSNVLNNNNFWKFPNKYQIGDKLTAYKKQTIINSNANNNILMLSIPKLINQSGPKALTMKVQYGFNIKQQSLNQIKNQNKKINNMKQHSYALIQQKYKCIYDKSINNQKMLKDNILNSQIIQKYYRHQNQIKNKKILNKQSSQKKFGEQKIQTQQTLSLQSNIKSIKTEIQRKQSKIKTQKNYQTNLNKVNQKATQKIIFDHNQRNTLNQQISQSKKMQSKKIQKQKYKKIKKGKRCQQISIQTQTQRRMKHTQKNQKKQIFDNPISQVKEENQQQSLYLFLIRCCCL